jgi:penicillin-binding protein 2
MLRDIRKNKIFNRRAFIIGACQSSVSLALVTKLGYLQLVRHNKYSIQSDRNRIKPIINPAPRGIILDRNGVALAKNNNNYRLFLFIEKKGNAKQLIDTLSEVLLLDSETAKNFLTKIQNGRKNTIISLIDNIAWDDLARIESNIYRLPGVSIESGVTRFYPFPLETAHFLGYVSLPSEKEVGENEQNLFMHPDFRVGKAGIERSFDEILRGNYGVKYVEVDAIGTQIRTLSAKNYDEGSRLRLTIDARIQQFTTEKIKDEVASVVLLDIKTGEVISYASSPSFDPNNFVEGVSRQYWQGLNDDPKKPLNNKPISALYPPGSIFKLMVALSALENGVNPEVRINCNGSYQSGKRSFHCWKEGGHGSVNMLDAITQSCNVFFFTIANRLGINKISEMASRFGYGEKLDISLYGAKSGLVPSEEWKQKNYGVAWSGGDTLNTAIGQGFVLATPLQMALVTARIANGGIPIKPYLVKNKNIETQFDELKSSPLVELKHINLIKEGMRRVVNDPRGTAFLKRIEVSEFEMAGKTGTSQVISKREDEMSKAEIAKKTNQNHGVFVGFAPVLDPKYAISIVVEHGKSGSSSAAPIGRDILLEVQKNNTTKNHI